MIFATTPSQTVGPYFAIGLPWPEGPHAVPSGTPGAITITGTVYDGAGDPVPDHLIETWQADPAGRFADLYGYGGPSELAGFRGFARYGVEDGDGTFDDRHRQARGGPGGGRDASRRRTSTCRCSRAGMLNRCVTRIYFADEEQANAADPVLARVPARATPDPDGGAVRGWLPLRHPPPGAGRDGLLCRLSRLCSPASTRAARPPSELDDRAWLQAMLDVEAALARACAAEGLIPAESADEIAAAANAERFDPVAIGREAARHATPVIAARGGVCARRSASRRAPTCTSAPPARTSSTRR